MYSLLWFSSTIKVAILTHIVHDTNDIRIPVSALSDIRTLILGVTYFFRYRKNLYPSTAVLV